MDYQDNQLVTPCINYRSATTGVKCPKKFKITKKIGIITLLDSNQTWEPIKVEEEVETTLAKEEVEEGIMEGILIAIKIQIVMAIAIQSYTNSILTLLETTKCNIWFSKRSYY